jgi:hypothetical protein
VEENVMKTLVIHPNDPTTKFLDKIYKGRGWTIIDFDVSDKELREQIINHDRIVMLGHGTGGGLMGYHKMVINSTFVDVLREKECVCIWCNADLFVQKYGLKGFYTGMIISEMTEANFFNVKCSPEELVYSNTLFAVTMKHAIMSPDMLDDAKMMYESKVNNSIIDYNKKNMYYSKTNLIMETEDEIIDDDEKLIYQAIEQIKQDIEYGDVEALFGLLRSVPEECLRDFISEI